MTRNSQPVAPPTDPAERAAFELVPGVLKTVRLEPYDHGGRQGAVDARLHYPDGRVAALEVTSAAGEGVRQLYALLGEEFETLPNPGNWMWSATVDHPRDLPELAARCGRIILRCEAAGIASPKHAYELMRDPDINWLMRSSVDLHGTPNLPKMDGERERPLYVTQGGKGGTVNESLSKFAEALDVVLGQPHIQRRAAKLGRSGYDERHLFVAVDESVLPFDVHYALMARDVMPPNRPALPTSVTHLWLLITFAPWLFLVTSDGMKRFRRADVIGDHEDSTSG
jgi:hypothetical protein